MTSGDEQSGQQAALLRRQQAIRSLIEFPYLDNYLRLSFIEWDHLKLTGSEQILFVGSGPFPLTAVVLNLISRAAVLGRLEEFRSACHQTPMDTDTFCELVENLLNPAHYTSAAGRLKIELLDRSREATSLASQLLEILGLTEDLWTTCSLGEEVRMAPETSILYLASMVATKHEVISHLLKQAVQPLKILIRGVEPNSLKELLYEPLSAETISNIASHFPGFREIETYWPDNKSGVINSVHIFLYDFMQ